MNVTVREAPSRDLLEAHKDEIQEICRRYGVRSLRIFGSVARGKARPDSDVDLLVRFRKPISLLQLIRLERELSEVLGVRVDLVTVRSLSPYIRSDVLASSKVLYENSN